MPSSPFRRATALLSFGAIVTALIVVSSPIAANAHDQVISTAPASQEHLDAAPGEVSMELSADILDIGATILVVDDAGKNWAFGDMRVEGREAIQTVEAEMPDGNYQVRWRAVSSDGHPISGTFDFAVGDAPAVAAAPDTAIEPSPEPSLAAATDSTADRNDTAPPPFLLIGIGGGLAGLLVFLLVIFLVKPRHRRS